MNDSEAEIRTALDLDRASLKNRVVMAKILYFRRKYAEAVSELQQVLKMDPKYPDGLRILAPHTSRKAGTRRLWRPIGMRGPMNSGDGLLAHALAVSGNRRESLTTLRALMADARGSSTAALAIATGYVGLGAYEDAFHWLECASRRAPD